MDILRKIDDDVMTFVKSVDAFSFEFAKFAKLATKLD